LPESKELNVEKALEDAAAAAAEERMAWEE
jgi:hypothetical protein